ncbi:MAG: AraC family transcriptional regulator [Anaerostipes sp.]|nr:AraC family transcriptional regulator [Anaerostipes sp.]
MKLLNCNIKLDNEGKEIVQHKSAMFPISFYDDNLHIDKVPWHWHDDFELLIVTEGSILVKTGIREFKLQEGEGCFINSEILHTVLPLDKDCAKLHSLVYHPRLVGGSRDQIIWHKYIQPIIDNNSIDSVVFHISKEWNQHIINQIDSIWHILLEEVPGYEIKVRNELSDILFMIHNHCPGELKQISQKDLRNTNRVKKMLEYIQNNYMKKIIVADLARCSAISESECLRCFKEIIGIPPIQYVKEFRIQKATELLKTTNMKVSDVGFACGFQDMSYFAKTFEKLVGCTPSKYS